MKSDRLIYGIAAMFLLLVSCSSPVKTEFTERERNKAVRDLVSRVTSGRQDAFRLKITDVQQDGKDWFSVYSEDGRIVLEGNNGVSVASALNHYLKEYCGWHYTWCGKDTALPATLPLPDGKVTKVSPYKYRYYLNYCTFNYTMSWWDSGRWQQEIDFMALNGINMPLAVTGQNSVWQRVYRKLGFTDKELESFFSGPAYFNWFWMGNLDGWGGPLPQGFMDRHEELQKNILFAERSLGMTPVLPAFTGHVPPAFGEKFPDAKIRKTSWVNFPEVLILDPGEELFTEIGRLFIEEQTKLYGTNHYYTADTFNENTPPTNDSTFLNDISNKVYNSMSEVDPDAVWVMQGWLFYHGRKFWGDNEIRALLGGVPDDRMLILDLWSERFPVWSRTEAYYGKPWIWCMLHNFGQNITLSGNVTSVANDPAGALHDPGAGKMLGIGLTMEGIGQNPAMYALMLENVWRDTPVDKDAFRISYLENRYGVRNADAEEAWKIIFGTAYENHENNGGNECIVTGRPSFMKNPGGTTNVRPHYDPKELVRAWELLVKAAPALGARDGFRYDIVDVTRQVLANYASSVQQEMALAYEKKDLNAFEDASSRFIALIEDMDSLLATRDEFLLGNWLEDARAMGDTADEKALYEKNARNLLTLWGGPDCRIRDYACRQWSGMLNGFYRERWLMFISDVRSALAAGRDFDAAAFNDRCKEWEWNWVSGSETYPASASGDAVARSVAIFDRYFDLVSCSSVEYEKSYGTI
ncbi:MAG: alpha-N-acetylglucosaminidase [Bacteroidales bacterium]|nr:alpha-N-acetylglucosaminidase [Bacteroidales bacterium]